MIPKEELQKFWTVEYSRQEIADHFNCDSTTVTVYAQKYNLGMKPKNKIHIPKEELQKFWTKEFNMTQIAKKFNCSIQLVSRTARKYNLGRKPTAKHQNITVAKEPDIKIVCTVPDDYYEDLPWR